MMAAVSISLRLGAGTADSEYPSSNIANILSGLQMSVKVRDMSIEKASQ
jgi:hypothetical protein